MPQVFLGGTVGNNPWRQQLIADVGLNIDFFDPVVKDWNAEAQAAEDLAKRSADLSVFYITDPMEKDNPVSTYSLVEMVMALYDRPENKTVIYVDTTVGGLHIQKVMRKIVADLLSRFPFAQIFTDRAELVRFLIDWAPKHG